MLNLIQPIMAVVVSTFRVKLKIKIGYLVSFSTSLNYANEWNPLHRKICVTDFVSIFGYISLFCTTKMLIFYARFHRRCICTIWRINLVISNNIETKTNGEKNERRATSDSVSEEIQYLFIIYRGICTMIPLRTSFRWHATFYFQFLSIVTNSICQHTAKWTRKRMKKSSKM